MKLRTTHDRLGPPGISSVLATLALLFVLGCGGGGTPTEPDGGGQGSTGAVTHRGAFHAVDHPGTGVAEIVVAPDGSRSLRLTNFLTDAGPGLEVYLVAAADAFDSQTVLDAGYVTLGALLSPAGNQSYRLPSDVDLDVYRSVSIWCVPFRVNFTTAPLTPVPVAGT